MSKSEDEKGTLGLVPAGGGWVIRLLSLLSYQASSFSRARPSRAMKMKFFSLVKADMGGYTSREKERGCLVALHFDIGVTHPSSVLSWVWWTMHFEKRKMYKSRSGRQLQIFTTVSEKNLVKPYVIYLKLKKLQGLLCFSIVIHKGLQMT